MNTVRSNLASWFAPVVIDNLNKRHAMMRAAEAKAAGLDPTEFGTVFPGSNVTNTTNNTGSGLLKGALLTAGTLAAGSLGTMGLVNSAKPSAPVPASNQPYDAIVEEQQADGSWKVLSRTRVTAPSK